MSITPRRRRRARPTRRLRTSSLLGVVLVLAAAPAGGAQPVGCVSFEGNASVATGDLREVMLTTGRGWKFWRRPPDFDEETLREDVERVAARYRDRGFYEASVRYELDEEGLAGVDVRIEIEEGEPIRVAEFALELPPGAWLSEPEREEFQRELPLQPGAIFGPIPYRDAKAEILRRLADRGRPAAALEGGAQVDLETRSARVGWTVIPGPEVRFAGTDIEGLVGVEAGLVERELTYRPGEMFSQRALDESQRRIYALRLFRSVTVTARREPADRPESADATAAWRVLVRVEERPPRSIRLSVGYGTEDEFRARASWKHHNFYGGGRTLELIGQYSSLVLGSELRFTQPRFPDPPTRLLVDTSFLRETEPAYRANRASTGFLFERTLSPRWTARAGYRFEYTDIIDLEANDPDAADSSRLGSLVLGIRRSTVDDLLSPSRGTRLDFSVRPTLGALGSDRDFLTLRAGARAFAPLGPTVLALRLDLASIQSILGTERDGVPIQKRLFSGGTNSVRGFEYQKLGPLDSDGDPLGGLTLTEASAELRFPIWRFLGGVAFFDAGQVARAPFTFELDDVYYGAGPGLRISTPVGSLGLDWAYALRRPVDADRWRIHFSVGATF